MFVVRCDVLVALLADDEWRKRLENIKSVKDVERVVCDFGKAKGYVIVEVPA